ncbi:MAG TPA: CTP synthetase, partial [Polyangiaceae bacterium]|nr:CTP synthetase [Polyangiaceae bacterium]
ARNVCGLKAASSTEFDKDCPQPVIDLMPDQRGVKDKGGTMRLGSFPCVLRAGTRAAEIYGRAEITERHRHRFEFNNDYREALPRAGLVLSGTSPDDRLVEIIELPEHPYFLGCQFHPEFKSRPMSAHPLFSQFVRAACSRRDDIAKSARDARDEAAPVHSTETTVN